MRWLLLLAFVGVAHADQNSQVIRKEVKRHMREIGACFEANPGQSDKRVIVTFVIADTGRVTSATPSGEGDKPLQDCIAGVFKRMTFPAGKGKTTVKYPVHIIVANQ